MSMDAASLEKLSKEELIKLVLDAQGGTAPKEAPKQGGRANKARKGFDWSKHELGQVALKLAYVGWDYYGYASQSAAELPTVEGKLFDALETTCLVRDRRQCRYSRCGRTDRGVSALGQVVSLEARRTPASLQLPHTLNRVLPPDIRVLAWAPVPPHFNARYDCLYRTYKYFFARENMDIDAMRRAAASFVGEHDFRNFCKIDTVNVSNFVRVVLSAEVRPVAAASPPGPSPYELYELVVSGYAFLWHQVRCMAAVLFRVGRGEEQPDVVARMLSPAEAARGKPAYVLASEAPLVLWECGFEDLDWRHSDEALRAVDEAFAVRWREQAMRYGLAQCFKATLDATLVPGPAAGLLVPWSTRRTQLQLQPGPKAGTKAVRLLDGPREEPYEEKLRTMSAKKRQQMQAKQARPVDDDADE